jgi:predicted DNA-binding transcriptional regulator YafY
MTEALATAAVRAMRANDRSPAARPGPQRVAEPGDARPAQRDGDGRRAAHPVPTLAPVDVVATLRSAIAAEEPVWIGYADPTGVAGDRRIEPLRLAGGYLTALDLRTEAIQSFAVARITGVQPA